MKILLILAIGLAIGIVGGLVGIGGGVLLIPALTQFFQLDPRKAAGVSLFALAAPVTLPGAWKYFQQGHVNRADLEMAAFLAGAFAIGTFLGAHFQNRLSLGALRVVFGLLLLFLGVRTLVFSSPESVHTVAGLVAVALGWLALLCLRAVGRKHLAPPDLGEAIRRSGKTAPPADDYHI
jgi:uncharacterized membrane protein YfcA